MEKKREWIRPQTVVQVFEANEYVATCYSGKCDVTGYFFREWNDANGNGKVDWNELGREVVSGNSACGTAFNDEGSVIRVAGWNDGHRVTGYYFTTPGDSHVSKGVKVTNAS